METKEIVIVLTNKGYVAIEGNQIFDLWKNESIKAIYDELHQRYPSYKISLGGMDRVSFEKAVETSSQYLTVHEELRYVENQNSNHKNNNDMKHLTFNAKTLATLAKVTAGFTTQKGSGVLHLTLQTGADVLQFGANAVANGEATVLSKLKLYNESKEELFKIRQDRTAGYQNMVKNTPKSIIKTSIVIRERIENLINNRKAKSLNL